MNGINELELVLGKETCIEFKIANFFNNWYHIEYLWEILNSPEYKNDKLIQRVKKRIGKIMPLRKEDLQKDSSKDKIEKKICDIATLNDLIFFDEIKEIIYNHPESKIRLLFFRLWIGIIEGQEDHFMSKRTYRYEDYYFQIYDINQVLTNEDPSWIVRFLSAHQVSLLQNAYEFHTLDEIEKVVGYLESSGDLEQGKLSEEELKKLLLLAVYRIKYIDEPYDPQLGNKGGMALLDEVLPYINESTKERVMELVFDSLKPYLEFNPNTSTVGRGYYSRFHDGSSYYRSKAISLMRESGSLQAVKYLKEMLHDPSEGVEWQALYGIVDIYRENDSEEQIENELVPLLLRLQFKDVQTPYLMGVEKEKLERISKRAKEYLKGFLGEQDDKERIMEVFKRGIKFQTRNGMDHFFHKTQVHAKEIIPELKELLKDSKITEQAKEKIKYYLEKYFNIKDENNP